MSAFEGLRTLRAQHADSPDLSIEEVMVIVKRIHPDALTFDWEAAALLYEIVDSATPLEPVPFFRGCIEGVLFDRLPIWVKLMALGRKKFTNKLSRDERSMFRQAGLLIDPPTDIVIEWWDKVTGQVRLEKDRVKLNQAREAEKLSLEIEEKRLISIGVDKKPKWIAIEDNTAGYDVLSYEVNNYGLINRLIEVKSTIASPLRFYLTRNEWEQAIKYGDAFCFHIWDMNQNPAILHERSVSDIAPHVPQDNEKGKWKNAEIPVNI